MRFLLLAACLVACLGDDPPEVTKGEYALAIDTVPFWDHEVKFQELRLEQYGEVHGWRPATLFAFTPHGSSHAAW